MDHLRKLLCSLGDAIRDAVLATRSQRGLHGLDAIDRVAVSDTIYAIDTISEETLVAWFDAHWPTDEPVEIVAEGLDDGRIFPSGATPKWKGLIDPIDGTRVLMVDKRSAWVLAGLAPHRGPATALSEITVSAMTEIPTTKQWRADQLSAIRGGGLVAEAVDVRSGTRESLTLRPSTAADFRHGFAWLAKYFPDGRTLTAQIEEQLWARIEPNTLHPVIFDDQYLSTAGAFYELLAGHDRLGGDIRPMVHAILGIESGLTCHPYDVCTAMLLYEAGIAYEHPLGGFPDAPMDTTSSIAWVAFANPTLAAIARPHLHDVLHECLR